MLKLVGTVSTVGVQNTFKTYWYIFYKYLTSNKHKHWCRPENCEYLVLISRTAHLKHYTWLLGKVPISDHITQGIIHIVINILNIMTRHHPQYNYMLYSQNWKLIPRFSSIVNLVSSVSYMLTNVEYISQIVNTYHQASIYHASLTCQYVKHDVQCNIFTPSKL